MSAILKPSAPTFRRGHWLSRGLQWMAAPGAPVGRALRDFPVGNRGTLVNATTNAYGLYGPYGQAIDCNSQTSSGMWWNNPGITLGLSYTLTVCCKLDTLTSGSNQQKIISIPYRNDATWATPFAGVGFFQNAANGSSWNHEYAVNGSTQASVNGSPAGFFDASWRMYTIVRDGANVSGYRDGVLHSTATLGTNAVPDLANRGAVHLGQRNYQNNGEAADGQFAGGWIHGYAMTAAQVEEFHNRPWANLSRIPWRETLAGTIPVVVPNATPAISGAKIIPGLRQLGGAQSVADPGRVGGARLVSGTGIGGAKVIS